MNIMLNDDMDVHKVVMPNIWLFCKFSAVTKEWPTTMEYNGRRYKFSAQEVMPATHVGTYAGYAKYESMEPKIEPITHVEFGAFLQVIGTAMRNGNHSMRETLSDEDFEIAITLQSSGLVDFGRALHIVRQGMAKLATFNPETVPASDAEDEG